LEQSRDGINQGRNRDRNVASIEGVMIWTTAVEFSIYVTMVNLVDGPVTAACSVVKVVMPLRAALPARTNAATHTCPM
jgi:hypothetical protein